LKGATAHSVFSGEVLSLVNSKKNPGGYRGRGGGKKRLSFLRGKSHGNLQRITAVY